MTSGRTTRGFVWRWLRAYPSSTRRRATLPATMRRALSPTAITNDYATTVGSSELPQTGASDRAENTFEIMDSNDNARSGFGIVYRPPLGFLRCMKAFPGARITLAFNVAPEYGSRVLASIDSDGARTTQGKDVATPAAATDHKAKLTSVKYYAAMLKPLNNPPIPG